MNTTIHICQWLFLKHKHWNYDEWDMPTTAATIWWFVTLRYYLLLVDPKIFLNGSFLEIVFWFSVHKFFKKYFFWYILIFWSSEFLKILLLVFFFLNTDFLPFSLLLSIYYWITPLENTSIGSIHSICINKLYRRKCILILYLDTVTSPCK